MDTQVLDFWNKLMTNMWSSCAMAATNPFIWRTAPDPGNNLWQIPLKLTKAISDSFSRMSGDKKAVPGDFGAVSELVMSLTQAGLEGYLELQKKWMNGVNQGGVSLKDGECISQAPLKWLESVHKLLGTFANPAPGGGAAQESAGLIMAKYSSFSAKVGELLYHLYLPMDKASKAMLKKMEETVKEGKPHNIEEPSKTWLAALENSYLELLQSKEYSQLVNETAERYKEYALTREQVYGQSAKTGQPSQEKGVEGLSEEISKLREKLEELLKRVDPQAAPGPAQSPE